MNLSVTQICWSISLVSATVTCLLAGGPAAAVVIGAAKLAFFFGAMFVLTAIFFAKSE